MKLLPNMGAKQEIKSMVSQEKINRLFWHSRRGMLELDVLLVPFTKEVFATLSEDDQIKYEKLLTNEDQDLFSWFMQKTRPSDVDDAYMVDMILERVQPS